MTNAYIMYRREKVYVTVDSYFNNEMANVTAIEGFPFYSYDANAQGKTSGSWNCNGLRVHTFAIQIEPHPVEEAYQYEHSLTFSEGEIDEARPYRPVNFTDDDLPF